MKFKPFVSVIIPNYNHSQYLDERIQSVLNQTYDHFEIIILDDKSTDNSVDVINKYRNLSQISNIIVNEHNSGSPFSQWRKGVEISRGEIVWIAESDDSCSPDFLNELIEFYINNNLCMAFSRSLKLDRNGKKGEIVQKNVNEDIVLSGIYYIRNCLSLITNASSAIFSREIALSLDNYYWEYRGAGDWLFWAGIASKGNVGVLASPLNYYRVHGDNTTSRLFMDGTDFFELNNIYRYFYNRGLWPFTRYFKACLLMIYNIKYNYAFYDESIRERLLTTWKYNRFIILILIMRVVRRLFT